MTNIPKKNFLFVISAIMAVYCGILLFPGQAKANFSQLDDTALGTDDIDYDADNFYYHPGYTASGTIDTIIYNFKGTGAINPALYTCRIWQYASEDSFLSGDGPIYQKNGSYSTSTGSIDDQLVTFTFGGSGALLSDLYYTIFTFTFNQGAGRSVYVYGADDYPIANSKCKYGDYPTWVDCGGITDMYFVASGTAVSALDPSTVEIIEVQNTSDVFVYEEPYLSVWPGYTCWSGVDCYYPVVANDAAVGDTVYLIEQDAQGNNWNCIPENAIDTIEILTPALYPQGQPMSLPDYSVGTTKYYCLFLQNAEGDYLWSNLDVTWLNSTQLASSSYYTALLAQYDWDDPCANIATSSGSTWDDIRFGLECAAHKVSAFLFIPSEISYKMLNDQLDITKKQFPFNIYFTLQSEIETYATSTGQFERIPVIIDGEELGQLITTSSIEFLQSRPIYDLYYTWSKNFIYFFSAIGAFIILAFL